MRGGGIFLPLSKLWLKTVAIFLFFLITVKTSAQCPIATYTVGSNVNIPSLSLANPLMQNMVGGSVKIWGAFTVDVGTWQLRGVDVYFADNSGTIIVNANCTLDASENPNGAIPTQFDKCGSATAWLGINALEDGSVLLDHCIINNACTGVNLNSGSRATITNNTFNGNYFCIGAQGPITLLGNGISHNVFEAFPSNSACGDSPEAINLINVPYIVIGDMDQSGVPNSIYHYARGITAQNSNIDIYNTQIASNSSIQSTAIRLLSTNGVHNANILGLGSTNTSTGFVNQMGKGILSTNYNLNVDNARFIFAVNHIQTFSNNLPIRLAVTDCSFEGYLSNGIYLPTSKFLEMNIAGNQFRDDYESEPTLRAGLRVDACQFSSASQKGIVFGNKFFDDDKFNSGPFGMFQHIGSWIGTTQRITLEENDFYQNYQSSIDHEYKGIWLTNSSNSEAIRNNFYGNFGPNTVANNSFEYRGIDNFSSTSCLLSCNTAESLNAGFYFDGAACDGATFRLNEMQDNIDDLHLAEGTRIGEQEDEENKWPSSSGTEARFDGNLTLNDLLNSKFWVNTGNMNSPLWADPRVPASGWFEYSGNEPSLSLPCIKIEDPNNPAQSRASKTIIEGSFEPYKGYPATTWDAMLFAFSELMAYPSLRPAGSPAAQFYDLHDAGNVGKLQRARESWNDIALFSPFLESSWKSNLTDIHQKLDEGREQTLLMQRAQTISEQEPIAQTLATLNNELAVLQQENQLLSTQYLSELTAQANVLLADLNSITPTEIWETNLKSILTLLIQRHLAVTDEWTTTQYNTIEAIAGQCRHEGGIGVVMARSAINIFDYDDEVMCPGYAQPRNDNEIGGMGAILAPNPAGDRCEIRFDKAVSGALAIYDLHGQVLWRIQIDNSPSVNLETSSLPIGLYFLELLLDKGSGWLGKLSISH